MERTRWNDDLETWCDERYYRKDEVDEMISRLELNSGLVFSVEVEDEVFSVGDGVQEFRANLSYANGSGVDGKNVLFSLVDSNGNNVDTSLVTTDVDGFAVYEYTPTGIGNVFVTASYGTLLQETFEVWDTIYYDIATTGKKNSNYLTSASVTVNTDSNGTILEIGTNGHAYRLGVSSSTVLRVTAPFCVEFDVVESNGMQCTFYQSDSILRQVYIQNSSSSAHYRFEIKDNKVYRYIDDGEPSEYSLNYTTDLAIWLQARQSNATLKFKNLKVYSI